MPDDPGREWLPVELEAAEALELAQHDPGGRSWLRIVDGRIDIEYEKAAHIVLSAAHHPALTTRTSPQLSAEMVELVSPNGFDGRGPVPDKVTEAAKRIASLRTKFVHQWTPGMAHALTTTELQQLFDAAAVQAEWIRELHEAVHATRTSPQLSAGMVQKVADAVRSQWENEDGSVWMPPEEIMRASYIIATAALAEEGAEHVHASLDEIMAIANDWGDPNQRQAMKRVLDRATRTSPQLSEGMVGCQFCGGFPEVDPNLHAVGCPILSGFGTLQASIHADSQRRWADMDIESETMALAEEACEALAAFFRAVVKRRHGTRGSYEEWTAQLRKEVAQVCAVMFNIASIEGFDLLTAVQEEHERWVQTDTNHDPIAALADQGDE
jgi:hypothetical protein